MSSVEVIYQMNFYKLNIFLITSYSINSMIISNWFLIDIATQFFLNLGFMSFISMMLLRSWTGEANGMVRQARFLQTKLYHQVHVILRQDRKVYFS